MRLLHARTRTGRTRMEPCVHGRRVRCIAVSGVPTIEYRPVSRDRVACALWCVDALCSVEAVACMPTVACIAVRATFYIRYNKI